MRKNILKKIVTAIVTTAMTVCAVVAGTTEAKAETTKDIYLMAEDGIEYSIGFWSPSGITVNADMASDGWTYLFTKVEDGLYKVNVTLADDFSTTGFSICRDGSENVKCDPQWSGTDSAAAWTEFSTALAGSEDVYMSINAENDSEETDTIAMESAPVDTTTDSDTDEDADTDADTNTDTDADTNTNTDADAGTNTDTNAGASTPDTGDSSLTFVMLAVAILAAVVVFKKAKITA